MIRLTITLVFALLAASTQANPYSTFPSSVQGLVLAAEHRFNPAVQRYLAEQSLAAMPLQGGRLYYIFPAQSSNAQLESMQIHNLERLLDKRATEDASDKKGSDPDG